MSYQKINNLVGWIVFAISTLVYTLTIESNVSLWDCGEFIAGAYKLQVVHPPGAPLFLMVGRVFTLFAGSLEMVGVMINFMSGLFSALSSLFLFWSITLLAKKILIKEDADEKSLGNTIAIVGAGVVGAMAYTLSDTAWFSAVEGEVYAMSSFFTAIVFWAMLKWESIADEKYADRWLVLIAYLIGLSAGVHLLSLLAIPSVAFIYYFKKHEVSRIGLIKTGVISIGILGIVLMGVIGRTVSFLAFFDKIFVNSMGLPFNSGAFFGILLILAGLSYGIYYGYKKQNIILYKAMLGLTMIYIGFSSYMMVPIRANAEPSINMNNPGDVYRLNSYINREQYGDRPLLYGPIYTSQRSSIKEGSMKYFKGEKRYEELGRRREEVYPSSEKMFFPRIYSSQGRHVKLYRRILGLKKDEKPTLGHNFKFFFQYQLGYMYMRYFMWNFAGRQNDLQGITHSYEGIKYGNWISGIPFVDQLHLNFPQTDLPETYTRYKSRNTYFMLPFIIGILGLIFQYNKSNKDFWIITMLFLFTGVFNLVYMNQPPVEPRERDYATVGSYYTFCIWLGFGVLWLYDLLKRRKLDAKVASVLSLAICLVGAPVLMGSQNWDDHNRSGRKMARDFAINYLESCAPNAILFTQGDNDTYPLWYAQEVEGIRTDIRVINTSLLAVDWYIDKLQRNVNDAEAVPLSFEPNQYRGSNREIVPYFDKNNVPKDRFINLKNVIKFIQSDDRKTRVQVQSGDFIDYFPTKNLSLPVDREKVIANGTVSSKMADKVVPSVNWTLKSNNILRNDLMLLDILATNDWERPIYFAVSGNLPSQLGLQDYLQLDGLAYRLVPYKAKSNPRQPGYIDTDIMYKNVMDKFRFGRLDEEEMYVDENSLRMTFNLRNNFTRLAEQLIREGKKDSALAVLNKVYEGLPHENVPYNIFMLQMPSLYYQLGEEERALKIMSILESDYIGELEYLTRLDKTQLNLLQRDMQQGMGVLQELIRIAKANNNEEVAIRLANKFDSLRQTFEAKLSS